ncbi:MAG: RNA 2',3'-cyclic phosphodiesterase [Christensenella sp.]|nr:RNA 2',3'-cyclic phosphodiesterase [Christensenella sp.]
MEYQRREGNAGGQEAVMPRSARLFVAAELPEAVRRALEQTARRLKATVRGRFSGVENYHVTLAFLGDMDLTLRPALSEIVHRAAEGMPPIETSLAGLGYFGRKESAVLWCGLTGAKALEALSGKIRRGLADAGIGFDGKPMKAHITLARKACLTEVGLAEFMPFCNDFRIRRVTLFESAREEGKLVYRPLFATELKI